MVAKMNNLGEYICIDEFVTLFHYFIFLLTYDMNNNQHKGSLCSIHLVEISLLIL